MKKPGLLFSIIVAGSLFAPSSWSKIKKDKSCIVYGYIDDNGKIVKTTDKRNIPEKFRTSLISTYDCAQASSIRSSGGEIEKELPSLGQDTESSTPGKPSSFSFSEDTDASMQKKIYTWFAYTEKWKIALMLFFISSILAGMIGIIATAFRTSTWWGMACFLPPFAVIYFIIHWDQVWPSASVWLTGMLGGSIMAFFVLSFS